MGFKIILVFTERTSPPPNSVSLAVGIQDFPDLRNLRKIKCLTGNCEACDRVVQPGKYYIPWKSMLELRKALVSVLGALLHTANNH